MWTSSFAAESLGLIEFTHEALKLDVQYQQAVLDKEIVDFRRDAGNNLFRNRFEFTPYLHRYDNDRPITAPSHFTDEGMRLGLTQYLPLGTELSLGWDNAWENTQSSGLAPDEKYTLSLSQPLWRNQFGAADRLKKQATEIQAQAEAARVRATRAESCDRLSGVFVDAWTQDQRALFVDKVYELASELFRRSQPAFRAGQISRLDWLGVQSEYLNLRDQRSQAQNRAVQYRLRLTRAFPFARDRQLVHPGDVLKTMEPNLEAAQSESPTFEELYYKLLSEGLQRQAEAGRSQSHPKLDLKLSQQLSEGNLDAEPYDDRDFTISLNLIWELNDNSVRAPYHIARLEAEKQRLKSQELARTRRERYQDQVLSLKGQAEQIEIEEERIGILAKITDENRRRFLQGRVDFQDFLRVNEQWFESQNRLLDKQANYWKSLARFSLLENLAVPFCQEEL
ncbi:MAG: TolC family protein [Bdellovibrionales bacterium]